jgi:hypothetical protein
MSPTTTKIRDQVIGAVLTLAATSLLMFGTGLWASKESVPDHKADIQALNAKLERILDVLCDGKSTTIRACGAAGQVVP